MLYIFFKLFDLFYCFIMLKWYLLNRKKIIYDILFEILILLCNVVYGYYVERLE